MVNVIFKPKKNHEIKFPHIILIKYLQFYFLLYIYTHGTYL